MQQWKAVNLIQPRPQVFWKGLAPADLPEELVKKFDGKGLAVVGFEVCPDTSLFFLFFRSSS